MSNSLFLQLHALRTQNNVLLNRNDIGEPKTCRVGGVRRTRVSSQCRKYHWRHYNGPNAIRKAGDMAVRSRHTFRKRVAEPLVEQGVDLKIAAAVSNALMGMVLDDDTTKSAITGNANSGIEAAEDEDNSDPLAILKTDQVIVLGKAEVDYLRSLAEDAAESVAESVSEDAGAEDISDSIYQLLSDNDLKKNLAALRNATGIDAAMHGRMVTSDALAQGDAAIHVSHAFTTHEHLQDSDYFATTDDLNEEGSGHINQKELTSGTFYEYAAVDIPLLVSNLEGCKREDWADQDLSLTKEVLRRFVHTYAELAPGAKKSSTAPYAVAEFMLAEVGSFQPHSISFEDPVGLEGDTMAQSIGRIEKKLEGIDEMYQPEVERAYSTSTETQISAAKQMSLPQLTDFIETKVII